MRALAVIALLLFGMHSAFAHCPLCTMGAGGAALVAAFFGVSAAPVGVFVGAFGLAVGLWSARLIKRKLFHKQDLVIGIVSFLSVVLPVMPMMDQYASLYFPWIGEYGRTFLVDKFLVGSLVGAALLWAAPFLSLRVARLRANRMIPYQGVMITLVLLVGASGVLEVSL